MLVGLHIMNLILFLLRLTRLRLESKRVDKVCEKEGVDQWRFN